MSKLNTIQDIMLYTIQPPSFEPQPAKKRREWKEHRFDHGGFERLVQSSELVNKIIAAYVGAFADNTFCQQAAVNIAESGFGPRRLCPLDETGIEKEMKRILPNNVFTSFKKYSEEFKSCEECQQLENTLPSEKELHQFIRYIAQRHGKIDDPFKEYSAVVENVVEYVRDECPVVMRLLSHTFFHFTKDTGSSSPLQDNRFMYAVQILPVM